MTRLPRSIVGRTPVKDLFFLLALAGLGFSVMTMDPVIWLLLGGGSVLCGAGLIVERRLARRAWSSISSTFQEVVPLRPTGISILTGRPEALAPSWQAPLVSPKAGIFTDAGGRALRLVSYDERFDVVLPTSLIAQVEFHPGDGPLSRREEGVGWRRRLFGRYDLPTVFLGVRCGAAEEIVVYPLRFHPDMDAQARSLFDRLVALTGSVESGLVCPLTPEAFEKALPPSLETRFLPREALRRFWPDYDGGFSRRLIEFIDR